MRTNQQCDLTIATLSLQNDLNEIHSLIADLTIL